MEVREVKLGDVVAVKGGKRLPKGVNLIDTPNKHPYIRVRDLSNVKTLELDASFEYVDDETQKMISRYTVDEGDIILSIVGTIGLVSIVGKTLQGANLTENCVKLTSFTGVDKEYLYYLLKSSHGQQEITRGTVGAVQAKLPIKNIQDITIPLPDIYNQKKLSAILSALDRKIEINQKINENLQQQAQAIFSKMFETEDADLWNSGTLSDIAEITMGQSPSGNSYNEDGQGTVFFQGRAEFGFRFPTVRLFTTEPKRMALKNDTLMSVRAPVGDLNIAHEDCCVGRGLAAIRSKDNHQSFVHYTMFSLQKELDVFNGEGTVFGSINRNSLNAMPIKLPPQELIDEFEDLVSPMDALILSNHDATCRLKAIRDALLPKLMSGEIDLSDVQF